MRVLRWLWTVLIEAPSESQLACLANKLAGPCEVCDKPTSHHTIGVKGSPRRWFCWEHSKDFAGINREFVLSETAQEDNK